MITDAMPNVYQDDTLAVKVVQCGTDETGQCRLVFNNQNTLKGGKTHEENQ
jgi:hypothetical protein